MVLFYHTKLAIINYILYLHQTQDHIDKCNPGVQIIYVRILHFRNQLYFIDKDIYSLFLICNLRSYVRIKIKWIPILYILQIIQLQPYDLFGINSLA